MTEPFLLEEDEPVLVCLHLKAPEQKKQEIQEVYQQLTPQLLVENPEFQSSILATQSDPQSTEPLLIVSYWTSLEAYSQWETGEHRKDLRPLVRLVDSLRPETFVHVA